MHASLCLLGNTLDAVVLGVVRDGTVVRISSQELVEDVVAMTGDGVNDGH